MFSKHLTVVGAGSRAEVSNPFPRVTLPPPYQLPEDEVRGHDWLREGTMGFGGPAPGPGESGRPAHSPRSSAACRTTAV